MDRRALADAFAQWILAPTHDDVVPVPEFTEDTGERVDRLPAATVTYELADYSEPLPESVATELQLPRSATFAHAARLLWCLREDEVPNTSTYEGTLQTLQALPAEERRRYYTVVDEAVEATTTTLPVWPGHEEDAEATGG